MEYLHGSFEEKSAPRELTYDVIYDAVSCYEVTTNAPVLVTLSLLLLVSESF